MAAASITLTKIPLNGGVALPTMTALTSDGALIDFTKQDTKIVVLVENSSSSAAGDITFKAGNGIQGVADLVVNVAASATMAFVLESGAFKNVSGINSGKVLVTGATTMKVGALLIP